MKVGSSIVDFGSNEISTQTLNDILESLIGHFLYYRNQLEKPLSQLKDENKPQTKTELKYGTRSTPYKDRDNLPGLFATPLDYGFNEPETPDQCPVFSVLAESIKKVSIVDNNSIPVKKNSIENTPVIKTQSKRRILGKLQQVSVPITPKLNLKHSRYNSELSYITDIITNIQDHIVKGWDVKQIYILLGPTTMSPKETYCIDISNISPQATTSHTSARCLQQIMRTLVTNDFMNDLSFGMPLTNTYIMINVTKDSTLVYKTAFFTPQLRFHPVNRGSRYCMKLSHDTSHDASHDTSHDGCKEAENKSEMIFYGAPKPFKGLKSSSNSGNVAGSSDILDTIYL